MESKKQKYLLKGDISGIQEFIFNVSSKKAAKSLKARSFYVQLVGDLAMKFIEDDIAENLPEYLSKVLYNGGGNFFLNIETDKDIEQQVKKWQKTIDEELKYDEFYISLAVVKYEGSFGDTWGKIAAESNKNKLKKFAGNYNLEIFKAYSSDKKKKDDKRNRWSELTELEMFNDTENILWASITQFFTKWEERFQTNLFGVGIKKLIRKEENDTIANKLPRWNEESFILSENFRNDVVEREKEKEQEDEKYKAPKPNNIIDFTFISEFAKERTGTAKLGVLKMDIDDLSKLFRDISDAEEGKKRSKQLKYFFDKHIYKIWDGNFIHFEYKGKEKSENEIPFKYNIYPVFTGGDDCFFIGAWDAILLFSQEIHKEFSNFVKVKIDYEIEGIKNAKEEIKHSNGEYPTLSAGLIIVDEHFPVVQFAELVEEAIGKAKKREDKNKNIVKNAISVFDEVFTWNDFNEIIEVSDKLTELIATNEASKATLGHIRQSAVGFEKLYADAEKGNLNFPRVDRLRYNLREAQEKAQEFYKEHIYTNYTNSLLNAFEGKLKDNPMKYPVATRIAEFSLRNNIESR